MVIVLAVVLVAVCIMMVHVVRRDAHGCMNREDVPEEALAQIMQGEYPQYRQVFEDQARSKFMMMAPRI